MCYHSHLKGRLLLRGDGPQEGTSGEKVRRQLTGLDYSGDGEEGENRTELGYVLEIVLVGFSNALNAGIIKKGYQR